MNILQKIFQTGNTDTIIKRQDDIDLLLDWFRESKLNIGQFESDFFEPMITALRTVKHEGKQLDDHYDAVIQRHYIQYAFAYLISQFPERTLLDRFSQQIHHQAFTSVAQWHRYQTVSDEFPDLFRPNSIGSAIAKLHHAIHVNRDVNLSYLPAGFDYLKREKDPQIFYPVFNFVRQQVFREKVYMLFLAYATVVREYGVADDGNGSTKMSITEITSTVYDEDIKTAFLESIDEHANVYGEVFHFSHFQLLSNFINFREFEKRVKISIDKFPEGREFVEQARGNETTMLDHIIYYLQYQYLSEKRRYWEVMLDEMCRNVQAPPVWINQKIKTLLDNDQARNMDIILQNILTPLLKMISPGLNYTDEVVGNYETFVFKAGSDVPFQGGIELLREIAESIPGRQERNSALHRLSGFYMYGHVSHYSTLSFNEADKTYTTVKNFVKALSLLVPVSLKQVYKTNYRDSEPSMQLHVNGKDIDIPRIEFIKSINAILEEAQSPYRLVAIPLVFKKINSYHSSFLFSLAFMNEEEHRYFKLMYLLSDKHIDDWYIASVHYSKDAYRNTLTSSVNFHPRFTTQTDISFEELRATRSESSGSETPGFINNLDWEWLKFKYIDDLPSAREWYGVMEVMAQTPKGNKPTSAWLDQLQREIGKMGTETYFKELREFISASIKEKAWYFDIYKNALKGIVWSCAYVSPDDTSLGIIKLITETAYTKVPGTGARSTTIGNIGLEALVNSKREEAFGILHVMRNKATYDTFITAIEKSIDKFLAEFQDLAELLADKFIPDHKFKMGERVLHIPGYRIVAAFKNKKLTKQWYDESGIAVKTPPAKAIENYSNEIKEFTDDLKDVPSVFASLKKRVRTYWIYNRAWSYSDWEKYIKNNGLLYPHINGMIWTNVSQNVDFIMRDNEIFSVDNALVKAEPDDKIILWHPVLNTEENISSWQNYVWSHDIIQSERQVFREHYPFSATEAALTETPRFANHFLEVKKLMAIVNSTDWTFTYEHEGYSWPRMYIKPLDITAHLKCDYDRTAYAVPTKELFFTAGNSKRINEQKPIWKTGKIALSEVPVVTLSEVCRDIDLFIATTSIAHNIELSENRQEFKTYWTDYHKGLFSDDANSKVRKQIIEKVAPALKLNVSGFEGNYIIVQGKDELYRINLGSGFVQSYDSQRHMNLIPDVQAVKKISKIRLPIEEDETLTIILAKILYLQGS